MAADDITEEYATAMEEESNITYGPHPRPDGFHPIIKAYVDIIMDQYDFAPLNEPSVNTMNCMAMRELLSRRGLSMTGNKAILRDRLLNVEPNVVKVKRNIRREVVLSVWDNIRKYGEDGMGDKPAHMDTVEYWISHFDVESF